MKIGPCKSRTTGVITTYTHGTPPERGEHSALVAVSFS